MVDRQGGGLMALWYLTRATGATALVLLTLSLVLGVVNVRRFTSHRFPRFVIDGWHRTTSLLVCALLAVHIGTSVLDGYAPIRVADVFIPFGGAYRPLWLGLGALAFDVLLAVIATSLLRARLGVRAWRAVHWLAYACWPVALLHGLGTGSDIRAGWLTWVSVGCAAAVVLAVVARLADRRAATPVRAGAAAGLAAAAAGLALWLPSGPMAKGWAAKAGTPAQLIPGSHAGTAPTPRATR
jgi:sulfoxide reductase heme-binding subunit YedZ